jgi:hypothetical protein
MALDSDVDLFQISRDTHGFVGADLSQLCMEAALQCIRSNILNMDVESDEPIPEEVLNKLIVNNDHFLHALSVCDPSTLRENKVEVRFRIGKKSDYRSYSLYNYIYLFIIGPGCAMGGHWRTRGYQARTSRNGSLPNRA